jgi:nucleotide-binding universal stress UspA family protein
VNGTIVCGVVDSDGARGALQLASALSDRLRLRLVLAHVVGGAGLGGRAGIERAALARRVDGAVRLMSQVAHEQGLSGAVAARAAVGDRAESIARIAAEEGADLIVLGSRPDGLLKRGLRCSLVRELETTTSCPVVIAPPPTRRRSGRRLTLVEDRALR